MEERGLISGEPNRSEAGRDMGRCCVLPGEALLTWRRRLPETLENLTDKENPKRLRGQRVADLRVVLMIQGRRSLVTEWRIKP